MTTEIRQIIFSLQEVATAIIDLRQRCGRRSQVGEVVNAYFEQNDASRAITFYMQIVRPDGETEQLTASQAELGTAFIYFCRQQKIPLPIRASKLARVVNDNLALVCIKEPKDYLPLAAPDDLSADAHVLENNPQANTLSPAEQKTQIRNERERTMSRIEKARLRLRQRSA